MPRPSAAIDRARLPAQWPTTLCAAEFWEHLGRTIATFGLLEDVLGKAIFAFTATKEYSEEDVANVLAKWGMQLEQALTDTLWPLSEVYGKVVREHQDADFKNVGNLVEDIKKASKIRNALCHGSWHAPDASGKTDLYYFDKKDGKFDTRIDIAWLQQVQAHVVDLICNVINSVTVMGWEFPGTAGPGEPIWSK
ncbi:hypothetical protein [Leptothrix cholodnii]|nr:hypothetical protein [Leptothrix cholodnii]